MPLRQGPPEKATASSAASMNQVSDMRQVLTDKSLNEISIRLTRQWPRDSTTHDEHLTSGINCATVLVRMVYGHLIQLLWDQRDPRAQELESASPLMSHAWLTFGARPEDHGAALDQLVERLWGKRLEDVAATDNAMVVSFASLVKTAMKPLWQLEELRPFLEPIWRRNGEMEWKDVAHHDTPDRITEEFSSRSWQRPFCPSEVVIGASPGMDLSNEINKLFRAFTLADLAVLCRPATPLFFCATMVVEGVSGHMKLSFDAFRSFRLGTGKFVDVDHGRVWVWTGDTIRYNLVAIVRQRTASSGKDCIRVYNMSGQMLRSLEMPADIKGYSDDQWRLADLQNDETFFVLYVQSSFPPRKNPPHPEVSGVRNMGSYLREAGIAMNQTKSYGKEAGPMSKGRGVRD